MALASSRTAAWEARLATRYSTGWTLPADRAMSATAARARSSVRATLVTAAAAAGSAFAAASPMPPLAPVMIMRFGLSPDRMRDRKSRMQLWYSTRVVTLRRLAVETGGPD